MLPGMTSTDLHRIMDVEAVLLLLLDHVDLGEDEQHDVLRLVLLHPLLALPLLDHCMILYVSLSV